MALTAGRPWQDQQWLAHLCGYGLDVLGGLRLVSLVDACLLVGALLIAMVAARRLGGSPTWTTAIAAPVMLLLLPTPVRSQAFAMPLFAALIWLLARDARQADRRIWLVLPLLALWANVHGSVLLGSALVLLRCAIGIGIAARTRDARGLRRPLALALAALLAPFASPYGFSLLQYYRATVTSGGFHDLIAEWAGTDLPGIAGVLRRRRSRDRLRRAPRAAARALRRARPGRARAGGARHGPQRRVAPDRRRRAAAPRARALVSGAGLAVTPAPPPRRAGACRCARRRRARGRPHVQIARVFLARGRGQCDRRRGRSRPRD